MYKNKSLKFDPSLFEKITGFKIDKKEMIKILDNLGFEIKEEKNFNLNSSILETRYFTRS